MFSDGRKMAILNELVKKYPECLLNVNMIDADSRNNESEIEIDFQLFEWNGEVYEKRLWYWWIDGDEYSLQNGYNEWTL